MWALLAQTSVLTPGLGPFLCPTLPEKLQTPHLEKPPTQSRTPLQRTAPRAPSPGRAAGGGGESSSHGALRTQRSTRTGPPPLRAAPECQGPARAPRLPLRGARQTWAAVTQDGVCPARATLRPAQADEGPSRGLGLGQASEPLLPRLPTPLPSTSS